MRDVTRSVDPLAPDRVMPPEPEPASAAADPAPPKPAPSAAPAKPAPPKPPPLAPLDRRLRQRVARGSVGIDRRLDLHGLTQDEAHHALLHFVRTAQADGAKLVLVITGKGSRSRDVALGADRGVLRRLVPLWLKEPALRGIVLGFEAAHASHGGDGALYVRLRRARS